MTKDEALTMIIASIAMEELALSHIINAEGEKLQYILGTLPGGRGPCASAQEILEVNKSVEGLLDTVMNSQMLLKGKLEKALEAGGHAPPPVPKPSCPCKPEEPKQPCPCRQDNPKPPCGRLCGRDNAIRLVSRNNGFSWDGGCLLSWKCQERRGCGIRWSQESPALVGLDPKKMYALDYTINIRGPYSGDTSGAVLVRLTPCDAFLDVLPLYFSVNGLNCEPVTLHYSTTLFPQAYPASCADLSLRLNYKGSLFVEQASLNIVEI